MEFGIIASAIGVVGVAAQTFEVLQKVKRFVHDVKNGPSHIKHMAEEINDLAILLSGIEMQIRQTRRPSFSDPSPALLHCQRGIDEIAASVIGLELDMARKRKRGLLRILWRKDELDTHQARIERAKSSLILAYNVYMSDVLLSKIGTLGIILEQSPRTHLAGSVSTDSAATLSPTRDPRDDAIPLRHSSGAAEERQITTQAGLNMSHYNCPSQDCGGGKFAAVPTYTMRLCVSLWFWSRCWYIVVKRATAGWDVRIRTSRTFPRDSDFFRACGQGNLSLIQEMFSSGRASPFDQDADGLTAVHYFARGTLAPQARLLIPMQQWLRFYKFLIDEGSEITNNNHENWERMAPLMFGQRDSKNAASAEPHDILRIFFARRDFDLSIATIYRLLCFASRPTARLLQQVAWPPWQEIVISERIRSISFGRHFHPSDHYIIGAESAEEIWNAADLDALRILIHRSYDLYAEEWAQGLDLTIWRRCYGIALRRGALLPMYFLSTFTEKYFLERIKTQAYSSVSAMLTRAIQEFALELRYLTADLESCARTHCRGWLSREGSRVELERPDGAVDVAWIVKLEYGPRVQDWQMCVSDTPNEFVGDSHGVSSQAKVDVVAARRSSSLPGSWPDI